MKLFSALLIILGIIFLIIALIKTRSLPPFLAIGAVVALGFYIRFSYTKGIAIRKLCFEHGKVVHAKVLDHKRSANFNKEYAITVEFINANGQKTKKVLNYSKEWIWKDNPIGENVIGLVYQNHSFFAEEAGASFKFFNAPKD